MFELPPDKDIIISSQTMEEVMPMEIIKNNFKATISKLTPMYKNNNATFYEATTSFGEMTLVVQQFLLPHIPQNSKDKEDHFFKRLAQRNLLTRQQIIVTHLIYQQQIIKVRDNYFICMTLTEPIEICKQSSISQLGVQSIFENLVFCAYKINETTFNYSAESYLMTQVIKSKHSRNLFMDFTRIIQNTNDKDMESKEQNFREFKKQLCNLLRIGTNKKLQELMFVREKPFLFNTDVIMKAKCWFDLAMIFNLLLHQKVTVITESKTKVYSVNKLNGCVKFQYKDIIYEDYHFYEGFRLDGITELTYDNVRQSFFQEQIIYYMIKDKYVYVRKRPIEVEQYWMVNNIEYTDMVLVKPDISKVQFINFLIGYIKSVEPVLHAINFYSQENILQFQFTNKLQITRKIVIKFSQKYVVKDEELSMIIEKSKLKHARLNLEYMHFGDSFLIFLANCDKMVNVQSLDISYCSKITESGVNLLLASPFCKNLNTLKMCGLPMVDLSAIKFKKQLRNLHINDCILYEQNEQISFSDFKIERLQGIGVNISLKLPSTLKYLSLNSEISWQGLKQLKHLSLVQLKIRLIQNKKNITSFFSNIYIRDHPVKAFQEGNSKKTLKLLDVSNSNIKIKQLKPILLFQSMEIFICEDIEKDKFSELILPPNIVNLSLKGSKIKSEQLYELISKTNMLIKLNIANTQIYENSLDSVLKHIKFINFLQLDQGQLNFKLIEKKGFFQSLTVHIHRLIRDQHEPILHNILLSLSLNSKEINFVCAKKYENRLVAKINRFLRSYDKQKANHEPLININEIPVVRLINLKHKESINQHFTVINKKLAIHKQKIFAHTLSQAYGLPIMIDHLNLDLFNVTLHKIINLYPDSLLEISIRSNRILGKEVICLISQYAGTKLRSLDFRNCLFTYADIQQQLFNFPCLQSVNEGEYEICIKGQDNCEEQLQKILKFFMKLSQDDKLKLHISACQISESQLYFSILYQILHHYAESIVCLYFHFINIEPDVHSLTFWRKVFSLKHLQNFHLAYNNQWIDEAEEISLASEFQKLSQLNLSCLEIDTTFTMLIPHHLHFKDLKRLTINFSEMNINEHTVYKIIKNSTSISHLNLKMRNCNNFTSASRLSHALERMTNLITLRLDFQNCPLRQISIFELVYALHLNILLQHFELNISNCSISIIELLKCLQKLILTLKFCHIIVFDVQRKRQSLLRDVNQLLLKGIEIIQTD